MSVSIQQMTQKINVVHAQNGVPNFNMPMTTSSFKLYRNAPNKIEFQVRNLDRRPIRLMNQTLTISIIDGTNGETLLYRDLKSTDIQKGKAVLEINPTDTVDWQIGYHHYSIVISDPEGASSLLYMDENFTATGYMEVLEGALPKPITAMEITEFTPVLLNQSDSTTTFITSALVGSSQATYINTVHTIAVYCNDFTGRFYLQGSVENGVPSDDQWFTISLSPEMDEWYSDSFTGIEAFTIDATLMWVRFMYKPDPLNRGTIKKVLYKN